MQPKLLQASRRRQCVEWEMLPRVKERAMEELPDRLTCPRLSTMSMDLLQSEFSLSLWFLVGAGFRSCGIRHGLQGGSTASKPIQASSLHEDLASEGEGAWIRERAGVEDPHSVLFSLPLGEGWQTQDSPTSLEGRMEPGL